LREDSGVGDPRRKPSGTKKWRLTLKVKGKQGGEGKVPFRLPHPADIFPRKKKGGETKKKKL